MIDCEIIAGLIASTVTIIAMSAGIGVLPPPIQDGAVPAASALKRP